jgi:hypothetical protein
MRLKQNKTKGTMKEMRLKRNEIGKNLSLTEWTKSHLNSMRLKWNDTKGLMNGMRLKWSDFPENSSLAHACLRPRA